MRSWGFNVIPTGVAGVAETPAALLQRTEHRLVGKIKVLPSYLESLLNVG